MEENNKIGLTNAEKMERKTTKKWRNFLPKQKKDIFPNSKNTLKQIDEWAEVSVRSSRGQSDKKFMWYCK